MTKIQAEPGPASKINEADEKVEEYSDSRWVGNGRTILNNKGNAVKQYEPYFSTTHHYEDDSRLVEIGVTPILFYDAVGRLIKTKLPDKTFAKVEFDAWKQKSFDQNDTIKESSWYTDRMNNLIDAELIAAGKDPAKEKAAAEKAEKHHGTPVVAHLDSLGRSILKIEHNRDKNGNNELYHSFTQLDIEGNARKMIDARGNRVMTHHYDMRGNQVYQNGMDAGERFMFKNVLGDLMRAWDSRNHLFTFKYDALQRPTEKKVEGGDGATALDNIYEKIIYGEGEPNDKQKNLRGEVFQHYDTAGKVDIGVYDFKGQLLQNTRRLAKKYKEVVNWSGDNIDLKLESELFTTTIEYDALGRATKSTAPDGSITEPTYNEANLLEKVSITQTGEAKKEFVENINYDEKAQRTKIKYGNGVITKYAYDKETFRLLHLETKKSSGDLLQDLHYTYDPAGNITHMEDKSIPALFFNNQKIEAVSKYTYDSLYRLIEAEGREHAGQQLNFGQKDNWDDLPFLKKYSQGDSMAWRNYTQNYQYDSVGNIEQMKHAVADGNWTRDYEYETINNRLKKTTVSDNTYTYPHHAQHGFIKSMPHLQVMEWNFKDELGAVAKQKVNNGTPETTYYVYDGSGQRVRKVTENAASQGATPSKKDERIYLGGIEEYRKYAAGQIELERETLHVMDDKRRIGIIETKTIDTNNDPSPARLVRYQFSNHLGSAALETDESGKVISYEEYHPYGTTAYQAVDKDLKAAAKRYKYTGKERDEESGFYYHGARYYACWLGRWMAADPAGLVDGGNLYRYVRGNPVLLNDPSGMQSPFPRDAQWEAENYEPPPSYAPAPPSKSIGVLIGNAVGAVVVGVVELVFGGSSASAPTTEEEAINAPEAETYPEQAAKIVVTLTAARLIAIPARVIFPGAGYTAVVVRGGLQGSAAAIGYTAASDVIEGENTSPSDYAKAGVAGFVVGGAFGGGGKVIRTGKAAIKHRIAARKYRKALFKTGKLVEVETNRASEHPYRQPSEVLVAGPGRRFNLSDLDPTKTYIWIVDKTGIRVAVAKGQPGYVYTEGPFKGRARDLKHGDLVPGPGGKSRGAARAGGELYFDKAQGMWVLDNNSSLTFARKGGGLAPRESLEATKSLLKQTGTDTSKIVTKDVVEHLR